MLRHQSRGHAEQDSVGVDQANLLALAQECDRLPLDYRDTNLVGQQAHDGCALDPGNLLQLLAPFAERNEEDVSSNIFAEDRQHLGAVHLHQARSLNIARASDAKTRVVLEETFHGKYRDRESRENDQNARTP